MPMSPQSYVYHDGSVQLVDAPVSKPISFAHVGDLQLPPHSLDSAPPQDRRAIEWWKHRVPISSPSTPQAAW